MTQIELSMDELLATYQEKDEDGVREYLQERDIPESHHTQILTQVKRAAAGETVNSMLPEETVQTLATNTIAVMTDAPEHLPEWRSRLQAFIQQAQGADDTYGQSFFAALLTLTEGRPVSLLRDNPYANVIDQVLEILQNRGAFSGRDDPSPEAREARKQQSETMLKQMLAAMGPDGMREMLKGSGATDEQVDELLARLQAAENDDAVPPDA